MTRVKICGCMCTADALAAAEAGADFIGIMFADSRRRLTVPQAASIVGALGTPLRDLEHDTPPPLHPGTFPSVEGWFAHGAEALDRLLARKRPLIVGVFEDQPIDEVNQIAEEAGIDLVQLSGGEPWSDCLLANRQAIKVLWAQADMTAAGVMSYVQPDGALAFMLDSSRGTGRKGNWDTARDVAARIPLWLAGGLTPGNVADAVATVRPWCVDVSSGVESGGVKDHAKITAFVRAAKQEDA